MRENKYFEEFGKPFSASDVGWKIQCTSKDKKRGMVVPYIDARAISDRLDKVVGQNGWKDSYDKWHSYLKNVKEDGQFVKKQIDSQLCTIFIYDEELKEWIGKTDGAENTDVEPVKGGVSDSFKRAAVKWNIGRYLYKFDSKWVDLEDQYGRPVIAEYEKTKLESMYIRKVQELFGKGAITDEVKSPNAKEQPHQNPQAQADNVTPISQPQQNASVYQIEGVRVNQGENGATSSIILSNERGRYNAFLQGVDNRLAKGVKITNIQKDMRENKFGPVAILKSYDIAA